MVMQHLLDISCFHNLSLQRMSGTSASGNREGVAGKKEDLNLESDEVTLEMGV